MLARVSIFFIVNNYRYDEFDKFICYTLYLFFTSNILISLNINVRIMEDLVVSRDTLKGFSCFFSFFSLSIFYSTLIAPRFLFNKPQTRPCLFSSSCFLSLILNEYLLKSFVTLHALLLFYFYFYYQPFRSVPYYFF